MVLSIGEKFKNIVSKIAKNNVLNEEALEKLLREFRLVLLEADVPIDLTKQIIATIKQDLLGKEIYRSLQAKDVVIKALYDCLLQILQQPETDLTISGNAKYIMLVGLQGVGKTTNAAKLAYYLQNTNNKKVLLVSLDLQRKAAYDQLKQLANTNNIDFFEYDAGVNLKTILQNLQNYVQNNHYNNVILDTAGRLSVDNALMQELKDIASELDVKQIWLTLDAMLGQSSINVISSFSSWVNVNGLVITKADADYKGGLIISAKYITKQPIKFLGSGEKITNIEQFNADRLISRVLGEGDIAELTEKLESIQEDEAKELEENMLKGIFSLNDYKKQLGMLNKLGGMGSIAKFIPGLGNMASALQDNKINSGFNKHVVIINSMTKQERLNPAILNFSRKKRIASGSGTSLADINVMLKQYNTMASVMKKFGKNSSALKNLKDSGNVDDMLKSLNLGKGAGKNLANFNLQKFLKK